MKWSATVNGADRGHPPGSLAKLFSDATAREFRFLEEDWGCVRSEGIAEHGLGQPPYALRPMEFDKAPGLYTYTVRYSDSEAILDLLYGDKEVVFYETVSYPRHDLRFSAAAVLHAMRVPLPGRQAPMDLDYRLPEDIDRGVAGMAQRLRLAWPLLREPSLQVLDRALVERGRRMKFDAPGQRAKDRESASIRASDAFHRGDFVAAREFLAPYVSDAELSDAARKLYELARKRGD